MVKFSRDVVNAVGPAFARGVLPKLPKPVATRRIRREIDPPQRIAAKDCQPAEQIPGPLKFRVPARLEERPAASRRSSSLKTNSMSGLSAIISQINRIAVGAIWSVGSRKQRNSASTVATSGAIVGADPAQPTGETPARALLVGIDAGLGAVHLRLQPGDFFTWRSSWQTHLIVHPTVHLLPPVSSLDMPRHGGFVGIVAGFRARDALRHQVVR